MAVRSYWNMEKAEVRLGVQDLRITPMANSIVNQCVREAGIQPKCFLMEPANPGHARNTTTMLYVGTCPNLAVESPKRIDIEPQFSYHLPTWFRHTLSRFARNRHSHESPAPVTEAPSRPHQRRQPCPIQVRGWAPRSWKGRRRRL